MLAAVGFKGTSWASLSCYLSRCIISLEVVQIVSGSTVICLPYVLLKWVCFMDA